MTGPLRRGLCWKPAENLVWPRAWRVSWSPPPSGPRAPKDSWHTTASITAAGRREDVAVWLHGRQRHRPRRNHAGRLQGYTWVSLGGEPLQRVTDPTKPCKARLFWSSFTCFFKSTAAFAMTGLLNILYMRLRAGGRERLPSNSCCEWETDRQVLAGQMLEGISKSRAF